MLWKIKKRLLKFFVKNIPSGHRIRRKWLQKAGYKIGEQVYIGEDLIIIDEPDDKERVIIGDRVTIADRVTLIISSYPNFSKIRPFVKDLHGKIEIDDDAWLGAGCIIMPNIRIGKGAIIGAGAVVTKDVSDFTIVVGMPAKPLKKIDISINKGE